MVEGSKKHSLECFVVIEGLIFHFPQSRCLCPESGQAITSEHFPQNELE